MPALFGLSARDAVAQIVSAGLVPHLYGSGWVTGQDPPPGSAMEPGAACTVILGRPQKREGETKIVHNLEAAPVGFVSESIALDSGSP
jgi:hypothetical protein